MKPLRGEAAARPERTRRGRLLRIVQVALLAAVAWGIYRAVAPELAGLGWSDVARWRPRWAPLVASFVLLVGVYVAHALLWRRILTDLRIGRPPVPTTLRIYFLAGLGRYLPGRLWQLAGMAVFSKRAGLAPGSAAAAHVLGTLGFLTTGLFFLGLTLPDWRTALGAAGGAAPPVGPLALGTAVLVVGGAVLWVIVATPLGHGLRTRLVRLAGSRAGEKLGAAFELADRIRPADAAAWAGGYAVTWVVLGVAFAMFAAAFVPGAFAAARFLGGTVAVSYLAGLLFVAAPAGIGVREFVMGVLLYQIMPEPGAALVVSVLSRVWFTAAELAPLGVLALVPALRRRAAVVEEGEG